MPDPDDAEPVLSYNARCKRANGRILAGVAEKPRVKAQGPKKSKEAWPRRDHHGSLLPAPAPCPCFTDTILPYTDVSTSGGRKQVGMSRVDSWRSAVGARRFGQSFKA